jgi:hypothetical protein
MRSRLIVGVLLVVGLFGAAVFANAASAKRWAILNFQDPVQVAGQFVMGPVIIVHDDAKMARGEACTTIYQFEPGKGPRQELVSFHCRPTARAVEAQTTLTVTPVAPTGCRRLIEYQFAGDPEAHGVPDK